MSGISPRGGRTKGDFFLISLEFRSVGNITQQFASLFGSTFSATESNVQITADFAFLIRRMRTTVAANAVTGDTVPVFRINGTNAVSQTIATTVVGETATGVLSRNVAAGDLINWGLTVTDGAANTVSGMSFLVCQRVSE